MYTTRAGNWFLSSPLLHWLPCLLFPGSHFHPALCLRLSLVLCHQLGFLCKNALPLCLKLCELFVSLSFCLLLGLPLHLCTSPLLCFHLHFSLHLFTCPLCCLFMLLACSLLCLHLHLLVMSLLRPLHICHVVLVVHQSPEFLRLRSCPVCGHSRAGSRGGSLHGCRHDGSKKVNKLGVETKNWSVLIDPHFTLRQWTPDSALS